MNTSASEETNQPAGAFPVSAEARAFLDKLPAGPAGLLAGVFHQAARSGQSTPTDVVSAVIRSVGETLARPHLSEKRTQNLCSLLAAIGLHPAGAWSYADAVIGWNSLPEAERERRKSQQAEVYKAARMAELEPTPKQLDFLRTLGDDGPPPGNRAEASARIETLKSRRNRTPFNQAVREKAGLAGMESAK